MEINNMNLLNTSYRYGLLLGFIALFCSAISAGIYLLTKDRIEAEITQQRRDLLLEVIPQQYFDSDLLSNCQPYAYKNIDQICIALKKKRITAYAIETTAPDGYSGKIRILFGMTPKGKILGVRVLDHQETPGLGDKIETRISDWILSFNNQQINPKNLTDWAVKKDGGKFDQFAGATITPRAIVNQVKHSALVILQGQ